ncbi:FAD-binding domain-containing protein [Flexithrix dorotheae]|uniref:FAD-binding domain-containing protein n=1 Tax=Flexithrix dorotheae TaxID=70993 RepID=UPI00036E0055|nr:FAD-binding domain-containing protein [Flexithrix dorotheae]
MKEFVTDYASIIQQMNSIQPIDYGSTRNYVDGAVTRLSPYISRGVISTKLVYKSILDRGFNPYNSIKLIQELAWRDYWQQIWIAKGEGINEDLKREQPEVENYKMPENLITSQTGIRAVDQAIREFYQTGYMHNHMRMYVASLACNLGKSHWLIPAKWMYFHLLDADWASNALSWQWVAGANSNKKYFANQENINKFFYSDQNGTFLDVAYDTFNQMEIPGALAKLSIPQLETNLIQAPPISIDEHKPTCIYNFYNLDPNWRTEMDTNRILLLEPSHFDQYPIAKKSLDFMINLAKNITDIQIFTGEFDELKSAFQLDKIFFKEHPLNKHYNGIEDSRDWMFEVKGYFPSFFAFWKKCKKEIPYHYEAH